MDIKTYRERVRKFYLDGNRGYIQTEREFPTHDDLKKACYSFVGMKLTLYRKRHLHNFFGIKPNEALTKNIIDKARGRFQTMQRFLEGKNSDINEESLKILAIILRFDTLISKKERLKNQIPKDFVGRNFVFKSIDTFIKKHEQGYYYLIGNPGLGKTSLALKYAYDNETIVHRINYQNNGNNKAEFFIQDICQQLDDRYNLKIDDFITSEQYEGHLLDEVLTMVSEVSRKKTVIVVDGIDELKGLEYFRRSNILHLPSKLPKGIFFLLTMRDIENQIRLPNKENDFYIDHLSHDSTENMQDIRQYLRNASQKKEIINYLQHHSISEEDFINILEEKSEGNFMYLNHVIREIIGGGYQQKEISEFPKGLQNYYRDHWERMMEGVSEVEKEIKLKTIYVLAAYEEPISTQLLTDTLKKEIKELKKLHVIEVIKDWQQFLNIIEDNQLTKYTFYHKSFLDFLSQLAEVKAVGIDFEKAESIILRFQQNDFFDAFELDENGDIILSEKGISDFKQKVDKFYNQRD